MRKSHKKLYLIGNWKMNPTTQKEAKKLMADIFRGLGLLPLKTKLHSGLNPNLEVIICPPFSYLKSITHNLKSNFALGSQNCHYEDSGPFTGEVSPSMLKDLGVKYVIVGHSERREYFKEDNELINKKLKAVLRNNMTPILAVGEKSREGEGAIREVQEQLGGALLGLKASDVKKIVFAYEPVWAISGGDPNHKSADPNDVLGMRVYIKRVLLNLYNKKLAEAVPIIYGGSTNSQNIALFIEQAEMDGALPGTASLNAEEFIKMAHILNKFL